MFVNLLNLHAYKHGECLYLAFSPRYELPQYGSRRRLLSPSGMYDEYGEVVVEGDGGFYYSPQGPEAEVNSFFFLPVFCTFKILCS